MKRIIFAILAIVFVSSAFAQDSTFRFTTSDGTRLYVRTTGAGKPCVFVHGGPGSTAYYFEAMLAAPLIEQKMRMIYYDQRGCGRSDSARNGDYSLARMEKDIEELKAALGYKQWAVMGHSFGGILITNYAAHYPKSVSALMVVHGTLNIDYSMNSHLENGLKFLGIKDQAPYRDASQPLIQRVGKVHSQLTEKNLWYKLMYRNPYEKQFNDSVTFSAGKLNWDFANKIWGLSEYFRDFTPLTAQVTCPVLVMTGNQDYAIGPDHYRTFKFPRQTTVHYIGGHAPFQEEPQWFAEKILSFAAQL